MWVLITILRDLMGFQKKKLIKKRYRCEVKWNVTRPKKIQNYLKMQVFQKSLEFLNGLASKVFCVLNNCFYFNERIGNLW